VGLADLGDDQIGRRHATRMVSVRLEPGESVELRRHELALGCRPS
jgi:hypothetical protein